MKPSIQIWRVIFLLSQGGKKDSKLIIKYLQGLWIKKYSNPPMASSLNSHCSRHLFPSTTHVKFAEHQPAEIALTLATRQCFLPGQFYPHFTPALKTKHPVSWILWGAELIELSRYFGWEATISGFPYKHKFPWKPNLETEYIHLILGPVNLMRLSLS